MAVASYTALIGTSDAIEPHASLDELARLVSPSTRSRLRRRASIPKS